MLLDLTRPLRAIVDTIIDPDSEAHALQVLCEGMGVFGVLMAVTNKNVAHSGDVGTRTLLEAPADTFEFIGLPVRTIKLVGLWIRWQSSGFWTAGR